MKKIIIILFSLIYLSGLQAQIRIQKSYAGVFYSSGFLQTNKITYQNSVSLRLASELVFDINSQTFVKVQAAAQGLFQNDLTGLVLSSIYLEHQSIITFDVGKFSRPAALLFRPSPYSGGSQFEPPSKSVTGIGSAPGIKLSYQTDWGELQYGMFYDQSSSRWSQDFGWKKYFGSWIFATAGSWLAPTFVGGLRIQRNESLEFYIAANNVSLLALMTKFQFNWGTPYLDLVADYKNNSVTGIGIGVTKSYYFDYYKILIGFGVRSQYDEVSNERVESINFYIYAHTL